ncbi:MAG: type II toxin-antitoxin system VapB family antitoxin, partial [Actinomycetota bacterium]
MSLNIKNAETERIAKQLAAATGENVTTAVTVAVRERLERILSAGEQQAKDRVERMQEISADAAGRWRETYRSTDHADLLY